MSSERENPLERPEMDVVSLLDREDHCTAEQDLDVSKGQRQVASADSETSR